MPIRHPLGIPVTSHRYLIESLSDCLHPKTMLSSRLVKFDATLMSSGKSSVKFLAWLCHGDHRTVLGKNMGSICRELSSYAVTAVDVKKQMEYFPVPEDETWRIPIIKELLEIKSGNANISNFAEEDVSDLLNILCTT